MTRAEQREAFMLSVAELGASVCQYLPGAGNPEAWPTSRCDCKYGGPAHNLGEQTGCPELRALYARSKKA